MVANLRERGREQCVKYWPEEDDPALVLKGGLEVVPGESTYYADYTIREFDIIEKQASRSPLPTVMNGTAISPPLSPGVSAPIGSRALMNSVYSLHSRNSIIESRDRADSLASSRSRLAGESDYA